jgi:hypothetical protein
MESGDRGFFHQSARPCPSIQPQSRRILRLTAAGIETALIPKKGILLSNASQLETPTGNRRVCQPGERDVVEDIIQSQPFGLPVKGK